MSKNTKNLLIILGVAAVFCLIAVAAAIGGAGLLADRFKDNIVAEPEKVQKMAHEFIDYELPSNYVEKMGMDFIVYKMILIGAPNFNDPQPMIFLFHFEGQSLSAEEMTEQVRQSVEQQSGSGGLKLKVVETRNVTIDGQEAVLTVSEGTDAGGDAYRQWVTTFPGKTGLVLVMVQGEVEGWDDAVLDEFLSSIDS